MATETSDSFRFNAAPRTVDACSVRVRRPSWHSTGGWCKTRCSPWSPCWPACSWSTARGSSSTCRKSPAGPRPGRRTAHRRPVGGGRSMAAPARRGGVRHRRRRRRGRPTRPGRPGPLHRAARGLARPAHLRLRRRPSIVESPLRLPRPLPPRPSIAETIDPPPQSGRLPPDHDAATGDVVSATHDDGRDGGAQSGPAAAYARGTPRLGVPGCDDEQPRGPEPCIEIRLWGRAR
jgi:hypothetical protein